MRIGTVGSIYQLIIEINRTKQLHGLLWSVNYDENLQGTLLQNKMLVTGGNYNQITTISLNTIIKPDSFSVNVYDSPCNCLVLSISIIR